MQFAHAWDDPRLNEETRAFLRTREEDLGDRWAKIVRDAASSNAAELTRVRSGLTADTPAPEGVGVVEADANGVPVRLYIPTSPASSKKIVLYFHGGGWLSAVCRVVRGSAGNLPARRGNCGRSCVPACTGVPISCGSRRLPDGISVDAELRDSVQRESGVDLCGRRQRGM